MDVRRPVRLLYVGGVPRSGSTLADMMIGQLPGHVGVGELYYLWAGWPPAQRAVRLRRAVRRLSRSGKRSGSAPSAAWPEALVDEMLALQRAGRPHGAHPGPARRA